MKEKAAKHNEKMNSGLGCSDTNGATTRYRDPMDTNIGMMILTYNNTKICKGT